MSYSQDVYNAAIQSFRGDYLSAVENAAREAFSCEWWRVQHEYANAAIAQQEPSVLMRPSLSIDGNQWCALYGDNLQDGVAGFGDSPAAAMTAFNSAWFEKLKENSHD